MGRGADRNLSIAVYGNKRVYTGITNISTTGTAFNRHCTITGRSGAYDATFCHLDSNANCLNSKYFCKDYAETSAIVIHDSANVYLTGYFYTAIALTPGYDNG